MKTIFDSSGNVVGYIGDNPGCCIAGLAIPLLIILVIFEAVMGTMAKVADWLFSIIPKPILDIFIPLGTAFVCFSLSGGLKYTAYLRIRDRKFGEGIALILVSLLFDLVLLYLAFLAFWLLTGAVSL